MDSITTALSPTLLPDLAAVRSSTMLEVMRLARKMFASNSARVVNSHAIQVMWLAHRLAQGAGAYIAAPLEPLHEPARAAIGPQAFTPLQVLWAGLLHDIGKLDLPDSLLDKPGFLTPHEQERMREHPLLGFQQAAVLAEEWPHAGIDETVMQGILHHHERFDGQGYPMGLAGHSIPLLARIIAIADVYSALTTRRSYHEPLTSAQAIAYLQQHQGKRFDPFLVGVACTVFRTEDQFLVAPATAAKSEWPLVSTTGLY